jgi:hypothetical protein
MQDKFTAILNKHANFIFMQEGCHRIRSKSVLKLRMTGRLYG